MELAPTASRLLGRSSHNAELGQPLRELTNRRPRICAHDVERLHALLPKHGATATRITARGLNARVSSAEYIAHALLAVPHQRPTLQSTNEATPSALYSSAAKCDRVRNATGNGISVIV